MAQTRKRSLRPVKQTRDGWTALALVMSAGYVDGYGLFAFGTFLSFMSGNTTLTGYNLGHGKPSTAVPTFIAVVGFVCGAAIGMMIARTAREHTRRWILVIVATIETLVLLLTVAHALGTLASIAAMSVAMGILNLAITKIDGQSISLTFVTGTLSRLGGQLALAAARPPLEGANADREPHARRATELTGVWISFLVGACLAGFAAPRLSVWSLGPPIVVLALLAILTPHATIDGP